MQFHFNVLNRDALNYAHNYYVLYNVSGVSCDRGALSCEQ